MELQQRYSDQKFFTEYPARTARRAFAPGNTWARGSLQRHADRQRCLRQSSSASRVSA